MIKHVMICASLVIINMWGLAIYRSIQHYDAAQLLESKGELELARERYQWSIRHYAFGLGQSQQSAQALWEMADRYENLNQIKDSLYTLDLLRGGIRAIRSLINPLQNWQEKVDQKIATLRSQIHINEQAHIQSSEIANDTQETLYQRHLEILAHDERPHSILSLCLSIFFSAWLYSMAQLVFKGFDQAVTPTLHYRRYLCINLGCLSLLMLTLYFV